MGNYVANSLMLSLWKLLLHYQYCSCAPGAAESDKASAFGTSDTAPCRWNMWQASNVHDSGEQCKMLWCGVHDKADAKHEADSSLSLCLPMFMFDEISLVSILVSIEDIVFFRRSYM